MQESWRIESCITQENYLSNQDGEALNYHKNLEQKLINTITLPFVFNNKKNTYSNFTYNKNGTKLALITKNSDHNNFELIIYIPNNYLIEYEQKLNKVINKENYKKFILYDERNILYKLFGNLTFLRLSQDTTNLYFLNENEILLTSLDRKILIFIKLDETNEYTDDIKDKNNEKENIENDNKVVVINLEDVIYKIKKNYIDMNLKLSFINKNIDNLINNSIPKNMYMDLSQYTFGENFFLLVDRNKIILIFYIENNTDNKQYILIFFLNYEHTNNPTNILNVEEDQKMTLEFPINSSIKTTNILSIMAKIKTGYLVICLSFKDNQFQIILIDMHLRLFKKYISKIFYVPTKRKGNITVITDLFIYDKYAFIIFDFYYIIIFNLTNFSIINIINEESKEKNEQYINIKELFPKEYNKTFFIEFENIKAERQNNNLNGNNNIGYLYLNTKKNTKEIKFIISKANQTNKISKNIMNIFRIFNKKQGRYITNIISSFNDNELYFYLNFFATLQKYSKNPIFLDNYLFQILYIINDKIKINLLNNFCSKFGCIKNLLLLNNNKYFGIYNSFIRYNFSTIKFFYFIENSEEELDYINYIYEHKIIKNNSDKLNDYILSISNNYLILYKIIAIIILLIKYENKINPCIIKLLIKSNFILNTIEDRKYILNKFKLILDKINNKKIANIFNINKISFYSTKKKILIELRNSLMNINFINNNKNIIIFESVFVLLNTTMYKENIIEYTISEIKFIKFILYLIIFYLNQIINQSLNNENRNKMNIKIFNLYNINDILYSLDYLNISFESIYNKYFIKEIFFKFNISQIYSVKELFFILLILKMIKADNKYNNKILEFFNEYNNLEKSNLLIDPIFFLLLYQNNKESFNLNKNIKDKINNLIIELIEKKINEITHNKIFRLIFLYIDQIKKEKINNNIQNKIIVKYLQKEISFFEKEILALFKMLFKIKNNKRNYDYIKLKEDIDKNDDESKNEKISIINLINNNLPPPVFLNDKMNNKITYILSIINNIKDIFLFLLNKIKEENKYNSNINLIDIILDSNAINNINNNINENDDYLNINNISKLIQKFFVHFWLFNSLFIFINEMNEKLILDDSKEIILVSLLHIYFYYCKKYPNEFPILQKEIIQYLKFYISALNKQGNNISIKMKSIIEIYMDKEILNKNFKNVFKDKIGLYNIKNKKEINEEIIEIYNYIKINDIQFDLYLNQFKSLFLNEEKEILKCKNNYIINATSKFKNSKYYKQNHNAFIKYIKLLKYTKLIEIIDFDIPLNKNIEINDINISNQNLNEYNPQILFSIRKSLEKFYQNKNEDINSINNYIEVIHKNNNISTSENNTTIINNNTLYSFTDNNICEEKKEEEKNKFSNSKESKKMERIENKTLIVDIDNKSNIGNIYSTQLYKSENLDEFMKRIKTKKKFNFSNNYNDEEIRYKYLGIKLLIKYFMNKKLGISFSVFKNIKALYFVNQNNIIENQINILINEKEE